VSHDQPSKTEQTLSNMQKGAQTALASGKTLTIGGVVYNQQTYAQAVGVMIGRYDAVRHDRTQLAADLADRLANGPQVKQFIQQTKAAVAYVFGEDSQEFSDFGFTPRKKSAELTPEEKELKTARLRATRQARNTMGSRQKKVVKGVVPPPSGSSPASPAK
jgi:hypothetical protein